MMTPRITRRFVPWMKPFSVPMSHVRRVRLRHLFTTMASRSSSRASAPKALTTALHDMESASAPPMRVSQLLASVAAGATKPSEMTMVQAI
ncbi:hypothetical protein P038_01905 [Brucella abortus 99-9971-135]|nr:hypothetical protein C082_00131 [Brucella abortus 80/102]ENQ11414.1 hypothetical protein C083_00069 [Brucella abortus LEVI237]ENR53281.1 hypothetical protein B991_01997 [Brucella abortus 63/130]ENS25025.1 hypothetical protein C081_00068 [Brucella abortus F5/04-7]ENS48789.1 hypothetical protein B980_00510 [Brucella abortus R42-08]ERS18447.1 hypothetical protein N509_00196 [Brucella abortus BC95]ERT85828.1 hypothetical protein P050_01005 [Brucella abortus 90-12178]ERT93923.1 hypothetical pr